MLSKNVIKQINVIQNNCFIYGNCRNRKATNISKKYYKVRIVLWKKMREKIDLRKKCHRFNTKNKNKYI